VKLLLATRNAHKAAEARRILAAVESGSAAYASNSPAPGSLKLVALDEAGVPFSAAEDDLEQFETFEENADAKSAWFARHSQWPVIADDSGLEVDALGGRPGVRSKRFAPASACAGMSQDEANNRRLLRLLEGVPALQRSARYVCVVSLAMPDSDEPPVRFRGTASGFVLSSPQGSGGFGYDSVIFDREWQCSYAELSPEEKDARSHRGRAFRALALYLARRFQL